MTAEQKQFLDAYFGFVKRKKCSLVGMKLDEALSLKKVALLIILPECSEKNEEKLRRHGSERADMKVIRYEGEYDIKGMMGYEALKAIGILDVNLAKAIYSTLSESMKKEETI